MTERTLTIKLTVEETGQSDELSITLGSDMDADEALYQSGLGDELLERAVELLKEDG